MVMIPKSPKMDFHRRFWYAIKIDIKIGCLKSKIQWQTQNFKT